MDISTEVFDQLALVSFDFDLWSGEVKLEEIDFTVGVGGKLPDPEASKLGQKILIDKKHLKPFNRCKSSARRLLAKYGRKFLGPNTFAVPIADCADIEVGLQKIEDDFANSVQDFLSNYPRYRAEWDAAKPEMAASFQASAPSVAKLTKRFAFQAGIVRLNAASVSQVKNLAGKVESLSDGLLDEAQQEAKDFFTRVLANRESCKSTTIVSLQNLRKKIAGLAFLDSSFRYVIRLLDEAIQAYPVQGPLSGKAFYTVMAAVLVLANPDQMRAYINGQLSVNDQADSFFASATPATEEQASDLFNSTQQSPETMEIQVEQASEEIPVLAEPTHHQESPAPLWGQQSAFF